MNIFDDKNLFDDDFNLLLESADSLFGQNIAKTPEKLLEKEINSKKKLEEPQENQDKKIGEQFENKGNEPLGNNNFKKVEKEDKKQEKLKKNKQKKFKNNNAQNINSGLNKNVNNEIITNVEQSENKDKNTLSNIKPSKSKKEKQPRKKLSKRAIIILCAVFVAIAIILTFIGLYIKKINTKLAIPSCSVIQLQGETIINIEKVENALAYEISISKAGTSNLATFTSSNTLIELKSLLNQPGVFNIKVRALGRTNNATSEYSDSVVVTNYIKLKTPNIFKDGSMLSWNPVEKAIKYKLFFRANLESDVVDFFEIEQNDNIITFDLSLLHIYGPNAYPICVQAICDEEYYLDSDYSSTINYQYYAKLQEPAMAKFNFNSKMLSFIICEQDYIPPCFKLSVLRDTYQQEEYIIYTQEVTHKYVEYNDSDCLELTASFADILEGQITSASLMALAFNSYATNSNICDVIIEY